MPDFDKDLIAPVNLPQEDIREPQVRAYTPAELSSGGPTLAHTPDIFDKLNAASKSSRYDKIGPFVTQAELEANKRYDAFNPTVDNQEDFAAYGQGTIEKAVNGILKGANLAATTVAGGFGMLGGAIASPFTGKLSTIWDNPVMNALDEWNNKVDQEYLPNYYTDVEKNANWYSTDNWMKANFIFDKFIKNAGFAVGAMYSGNLANAFLKGAGRLLGAGAAELALSAEASQSFKLFTPLLRNTARAFSRAQNIEMAAMLEKNIGSIAELNSVNSEIANISRSINKFAKIGDEVRRTAIAAYSTAGEASFEALQTSKEYRNKLIENYKAANGGLEPTGEDLEAIDQSTRDVGAASFLGNLAVLGVTEYFQLNKLLGSTYSAEKQAANSMMGQVNETVVEGGLHVAAEATTKFGKLYDKVIGIGKYFVDPKESLQEGAQYALQVGSQNYYAKAFRGQDAQFLVDGVLHGLYGKNEKGEGVGVFNSKEGGESMLLGAFTGGGMQALGTYKMDKALTANTNRFLNEINNAPTYQEAFIDRMNSINRDTQLEKEYSDAVRSGDKLEAKDIKADKMHNYLAARIKYGRFDLVMEDIADMRRLSSTEQGLANLKEEGIAGINDDIPSFHARLNNFEQVAKNTDEIYRSLDLRYSGVMTDDGKRKYSNQTIDKLAYASSKIYNYDQRIPQVNQSLIDAGISTFDILNSIIEEGVPNKKATEEAIDFINKSKTINNDTKKDLKTNLSHVIEMSLRRNAFIEEYNKISSDPLEYELPEYTDINDPLARVKQAISPEERAMGKRATNKDLEIGKEYSLAEPVRREGNTISLAPKIKVLAKTLGGEYEVQLPNGATKFMKPIDFKDYNIIESSNESEEFSDILSKAINTVLRKPQYQDLKVPEGRDPIEWINSLDNKALVDDIEKVFATRASAFVKEMAKSQYKREQLLNNKGDVQEGQDELENGSGEFSTGTEPDESIDPEKKRKPTSILFTSITLPSAGSLKTTEDKLPGYVVRYNTFINKVRTLPNRANLRSVLVTAKDLSAYGLDGLLQINYEKSTGHKFTDEEMKQFTSDDLGFVASVFVEQEGDKVYYVDANGNRIGNIKDGVDVSKVVFATMPTDELTWKDSKTPRYRAGELEEADRHSKAWLKYRKEELFAKPFDGTNSINLFTFGISRGFTVNIPGKVQKNAVADVLQLDESTLTQPGLVQISTLGTITHTDGQAYKFAKGRTVVSFGDVLEFLQNSRFTGKQAKTIFEVLKSFSNTVKSDIDAKRKIQLKNKYTQYLQNVLFWKKSSSPAANQIFLDESTGKLHIGKNNYDLIDIEKFENQIISDLQQVSFSANNDTLTANQKFYELYFEAGELKEREWKNYQQFLLASKNPDGSQRDIPLTLNISVPTPSVPYAFTQKYAYLDVPLSLPAAPAAPLVSELPVPVAPQATGATVASTPLTYESSNVDIVKATLTNIIDGRIISGQVDPTIGLAQDLETSEGIVQFILEKNGPRFIDSQNLTNLIANNDKVNAMRDRLGLTPATAAPIQVAPQLATPAPTPNATPTQAPAPVTIDPVADIETLKESIKLRQERSLSKISEQTKKDIKTGNDSIIGYATLYYLAEFDEVINWNSTERITGKTKQEVIDKINAKYNAELAALQGGQQATPQTPKPITPEPVVQTAPVKSSPKGTVTKFSILGEDKRFNPINANPKDSNVYYGVDEEGDVFMLAPESRLPLMIAESRDYIDRLYAVVLPKGMLLVERKGIIITELPRVDSQGNLIKRGKLTYTYEPTIKYDIKSEAPIVPTTPEASITPVVQQPTIVPTQPQAGNTLKNRKNSYTGNRKVGEADKRGRSMTAKDVEFFKNWAAKYLPKMQYEYLANMIQVTGGGEAWGRMVNGAVQIVEGGLIGTDFHEAMEYVWKGFLSLEEQQALLDEFRSQKGTFVDRESGQTYTYNDPAVTDLIAKERIMDNFADYMVDKLPAKNIKEKVLKFFKAIVDFVKNLFNNNNLQRKLFNDVNSARFAEMVFPESRKDDIIEYSRVANINSQLAYEYVEDIKASFYQGMYATNQSLFDVSEKNANAIFDQIIKDYKDSSIVLSDGQFKDLIQLVKESLRSDNFDFQDDNSFTINTEGSTNRSYAADAFTVDFKKSAPYAVKILTSSIIKTVGYNDTTGDIDYDYSPTLEGMMLLSSNQVYVTLTNKLQNTRDVNDFIAKLHDLAKTNSDYVALFRRLGGNMKSGKVDFNNMTIDGMRLFSSFMQTFTKQAPEILVQYLRDNNRYTAAASLSKVSQVVEDRWVANMLTIAGVKNSIITYDKTNKQYIINPEAIVLLTVPLTTEAQLGFLKLLGVEFDERSYNRLSADQKIEFSDAVQQVYADVTTDKVLQLKREKGTVKRSIGTGLIKLADLFAGVNSVNYSSVLYNAEGKQQQPYTDANAPSLFEYYFNSAKTLDELLKNMPQLRDVHSRGSQILKKGGKFFDESGKRTKAKLLVKTINGEINVDTDKGSSVSDFNIGTRTVTELNQNINGDYYVLIPADGSTEWMMSMGNVIDYQDITTGRWEEQVKEIFKAYLIDDIKLARDSANRDNLNNMKGKEKQLRFFEGFFSQPNARNKKENTDALIAINKLINKKSVTAAEIQALVDSLGDVVRDAVLDYIETSSKKTIDNLTKTKDIVDLGDGTFMMSGLDNNFAKKKNVKLNKEALSQEELDNVINYTTANYVINNIEYFKILFGDPFQFAVKTKKNKVILDITKRIKSFLSPRRITINFNELNSLYNKARNVVGGIQLDSTDFGYHEYKDYAKTLTASDVYVASKLYSALGIVDTNEADGASWLNPGTYREIKDKNGQWSNEADAFHQWQMAYARQKLAEKGVYKGYKDKPELKKHDSELIATPRPDYVIDVLKPVVSGNKYNKKYIDLVLDKYSQLPLYYEAIEGTALEDLYIKMFNGGYDYVVVESGRKVGAEALHPLYKPNGEFNDEAFNTTVNIPWSAYGIQVENSYNKPKGQRLGSQPTKIVTSDMYSNGVAVSPEAEAAVKEHTEALEALYENGFDTLLNDLGIIDAGDQFIIEDKSILATTLRNEMLKQEMSENALASITINPITKEFEIPFEASTNYIQIKRIIYSMIEKRIYSPTMNGNSAVQVPVTMWEASGKGRSLVQKIGKNTYKPITREAYEKLSDEDKADVVYTDDTLKFYEDAEGLRHSEILIPFPTHLQGLFDNKFPKMGEKEKMAEILKYLNKNAEQSLFGIGFRIPTDALHSMERFKIAGFLPSFMGNTVVVPSAITTKSGSDFDIDKLNMYLRSMYLDSDGEIKIFELKGSEEETKEYYGQVFDRLIQNKQDDIIEQLLRDSEFIDNEREQTLNDKLTKLDEEKATREKFERKAYRRALENRYYNAIDNILSMEDNFQRLISVTTTDDLIDISEEMNELRNDNEYNIINRVLDRNYMTGQRQAFVMGKAWVGIIAQHITGHSNGQKAGLYVNDEKFTMSLPHNTLGKYVSVSGLVDSDGNYISANLSQYMNAIVDIAKDPYIMKLIYSGQVVDIVMFLARAGVSPRNAALFLSQPIIRSFVEGADNNNKKISSLFSNSEVVSQQYDSFGTSYVAKQAAGDKFDMSQLTDAIKDYTADQTSLTDKQNAQQQLIFKEFIQIAKAANGLTEITQSTNFDTTSFRSAEQLSRKQLKVEQQGLDPDVIPISSSVAVLENTHIGKLEEFLDLSNIALGTIFKFNTIEFREFIDSMINKFGINKYLSKDKYNKISEQLSASLLDYIIQSNTNMFVKELTSGPNSVAVKLEKARAANPNLQILKDLQIVPGKSKNAPSTVKLSVSKLDAAEENMYANMMRGLRDEASTRDLYNDLVKLSIVQGTYRTAASIKNIIPIEDYARMVTDSVKNANVDDSVKRFKQYAFFQRNNFRDVNITPQVSPYAKQLEEESTIDEFTGDILNKYSFPSIINEKLGRSVIRISKRTKGYKDGAELIVVPSVLEVGADKVEFQTGKSISPADFARAATQDDNPYKYMYGYQLVKNTLTGQPLMIQTNPRYAPDYVYKIVNLYGDGRFTTEYPGFPVKSELENGTIKVTQEYTDDEVLALLKGQEIRQSVAEAPVVQTPTAAPDALQTLTPEDPNIDPFAAPQQAPVLSQQSASQPKGQKVKAGIYVNQQALTKDEQIELFNYLKPYLESQASKTNKGTNASKMIGLGLRWDYKVNNPGKEAKNIPDVINPANKNKYGYYDTSINNQPLAPISDRFKELMEKATGVDMTNYDGAIINLYESNSFISSHNDVDESRSAIGYPVIGVNLGGTGNFAIESRDGDPKNLLLKDGTGYVFGVDGDNREVFHRTFPTPQDSFLPALTTQLDGKTYEPGSYRVTITMRRVMPLEPGMPTKPVIKSTEQTVAQPTVTESVEKIVTTPGYIKDSAKKHLPKELFKIRQATQFIGTGGGNDSTTTRMQNAYSQVGASNTGVYSSNDLIYVSSNGNRGNRFVNVKDGKLQGVYNNIDKAIASGSKFIMDTKAHLDATSGYNVGEVDMANYLASKGYVREDATGIWSPSQAAPAIDTTPSQSSTSFKIIPLNKSQRFTRESVEKDSEYIYLFTDNAERTSGSQLVADESRYSAIYGQGKKYPTSTQAVIRGLDNAFPITTMVDDKRTQWTDDKFKEFKQEIDSEITIIKMNLVNFKGIKFSAEMPFGKGAISNMKDSAPKIWNYLNTKLAEIGIDNIGDVPVPTQAAIKTTQQTPAQPVTSPKTINIYAGTGENSELSNFAIRPFEHYVQNVIPDLGGKRQFQSVEQAFQWHKGLYAGARTQMPSEVKRIREQILNTTDGGQLRRLGRSFVLRDEKIKSWNSGSSFLMKDLLKTSFKQNPEALASLLATGDAELTHIQDKGNWGKEFPKLLIEVRNELRPNATSVTEKPIANTVEYGGKKFIIEGVYPETVFFTKSNGDKGAELDVLTPLYTKVRVAFFAQNRPQDVVQLTELQGSPKYLTTMDGRIVSLNPTSYGDVITSGDIINRVKAKLEAGVQSVTSEDRTTEVGEVKPTFSYKGTTIETAFDLTEGQVNALQELADFAQDNKDKFITLQGPAGTGKTSVIGYLQNYLRGKYNFIYMAPTHAATAELAFATVKTGNKTLPMTVASGFSTRSIGGRVVKAMTRKLLKKLALRNNVIVIDEVSMLNSATLDIVKGAIGSEDVKIIFMGDISQIPEVDQRNPATKQVSRAFNEFNQVKLTEVKRTSDNDILEVLTAVRNNINNKIPKVDNTDALRYLKVTDFNRQLAESVEKNPEETMLIAYTNSAVSEYNKKIRQELGRTGDLQKDDVIMGYLGYSSKQIEKGDIANSIQYTIKNIQKDDSVYRITATSKKLDNLREKGVQQIYENSTTGYYQLSPNDVFTFSDITSADMITNNNKVSELMKAVYDAKTKAIASGSSRDWVNFYEIVESVSQAMSKIDLGRDYIYDPSTNKMERYSADKYFQFKKDFAEVYVEKGIDLGHAVTIHKSQGSTIKNVFFDANSLPKGSSSKLYNGDTLIGTEKQSLIYVGMSRTSNLLAISDDISENFYNLKTYDPSQNLSGQSVNEQSYRLPDGNVYKASEITVELMEKMGYSNDIIGQFFKKLNGC
jgi:alkylated DNA repair dioxygenase AlkB/predicted NAD-dependent protein-ADP-ribosyltransferase YbiA (DUF1768 family)